MKNVLLTVAAVATLVALCGQVGQAAIIQVDLEMSGGSCETQAGWDGQAIPEGPDGNATSYLLNLTSLGSAAGITATLGGDSNGWEARGPGAMREQVTGTSVDDVVEDFWLTRNGAATIQFTGLNIGRTYTLMMTHNDSFVEPGNPSNHGMADGGGVVAPTALGATVKATSSGAITNLYGAQTDSALGVTRITFVPTVSNPVITLTSTNPNGNLPINGMLMTDWTLAAADFEGFSNGNLVGQGGWEKVYDHWDPMYVVNATSASGTSTKAVQGTEGVNGAKLTFDEPLYFTAANTGVNAVRQGLTTYAAYGDNGMTMGAMFNPSKPGWNLFGFQLNNGQIKGYLRDNAGGVEHYGDAITLDHLYEVQLVIDLATTGGLATLYRRDITLGETTLTADSLLRNIAMGLTPDALGRYVASGIVIRADNCPNSYLDNYFIVPEPGTVSLLAAGLLGLLAYAWRKRK